MRLDPFYQCGDLGPLGSVKCVVGVTGVDERRGQSQIGHREVAKDETFGPFAPLFRFKTEQEAIRMANDTEFGLASYFYTRDVGRIFRVAEALEYGIVGINSGSISAANAPFGGLKESGFGREGSKYGIEDYLEIKYLCVAGIEETS